MGNCLNIQLKESVQNNNLSKLNELRMKNVGTAPAWVNFGYGTIVETAYVIGGHFTDETGIENYGTTHLTPSGDPTSSNPVYVTPGAILCLPNKYALQKILFKDNVDAKYWDFDEDSFSYCTAIKYINLSGLQKSLDLSALKNMVSIISFTCKSGNVKGYVSNLSQLSNVSGTVELAYNRFIQGDISALSSWKNVNTLIISGTRISGSVNEFGEAMYNRGRVSGSLVLNCAPYNTFAPTVTYTDPQTSETKLINSCILTFTSEGVTYSPTYRS